MTSAGGFLPIRLARGAVRAALRAVGGAVYYAIYRKLPDESEANPYWREMHPDDDKGHAGEDRQRPVQPPPAI
jgi:hypothetical protein